MGNRTRLAYGTCCEFDANNCLPVTWLALFDSHEFVVETRRFEYERPEHRETKSPSRGLAAAIKRILRLDRKPVSETDITTTAEDLLYEECQVAVYQTSPSAALERVEAIIGRLKGQTPVWAYLRPLEILRDELRQCPSSETIELDVTEFFWAGEIYEQRTREGPAAFARMVDALTGDEQQDLAILDQLVNDYRLFATSSVSVADSHPENRMFVLIGTYWGDREDLYSLEYFGEDYWTTNS